MYRIVYVGLVVSLMSALTAPALYATPQRELTASVENATKTGPDSPPTRAPTQAAEGELTAQDEPASQEKKKTIEVQITGKMLSEPKGQLIEIKEPFKYGLRPLTTPTKLTLDLDRDHIFSPSDESCYSFEPFNLNLKKELSGDSKKEPYKLNIPFVTQKNRSRSHFTLCGVGTLKTILSFLCMLTIKVRDLSVKHL